jgi:hypothetical protein
VTGSLGKTFIGLAFTSAMNLFVLLRINPFASHTQVLDGEGNTWFWVAYEGR